jgi:hypothetical protein
MTSDEHRGSGIGGIASLILRHLVLIASDQRLQQLEAEVLAHNQPMLTVFQRSGLVMDQKRESSVVHVRLLLAHS